MHKVSFEQIFLIIFAAAAAAAAILILNGSAVVGAIVTGYVTALSAFLAVDLAKTITRTAAAKVGDWEPVKKGRYYLGLALVAVLFALTLLRQSEGITMESAQMSLGAAFMIIVGELIGAIQGNKIATGKGPES